MTGHALEIRLIKWTCDCKNHSLSGMCYAPDSHKEKVEETTYHGSFFYGLSTRDERSKRFESISNLSKQFGER